MKKLSILAIGLLLASCKTVEYVPTPVTVKCPETNVCKVPLEYTVETNGDLIYALLALREENEKCTVVVNTLEKCIKDHNQIFKQ